MMNPDNGPPATMQNIGGWATCHKLTGPKPTDREIEWSRHLAELMLGYAEVRLVDGSRADIVTATHAIEVEWAKNSMNAPGQAIHYATLTARRPGIILLLRDKPNESVYVSRVLSSCARADIDLALVLTRRPEFD